MPASKECAAYWGVHGSAFPGIAALHPATRLETPGPLRASVASPALEVLRVPGQEVVDPDLKAGAGLDAFIMSKTKAESAREVGTAERYHVQQLQEVMHGGRRYGAISFPLHELTARSPTGGHSAQAPDERRNVPLGCNGLVRLTGVRNAPERAITMAGIRSGHE
ncbi:MAG: hypothetical protein LC776_10140 [Acidobacteria bacterium]|nr:hypothetical protein [Acidobacteriota bacterium]